MIHASTSPPPGWSIRTDVDTGQNSYVLALSVDTPEEAEEASLAEAQRHIDCALGQTLRAIAWWIDETGHTYSPAREEWMRIRSGLFVDKVTNVSTWEPAKPPFDTWRTAEILRMANGTRPLPKHPLSSVPTITITPPTRWRGKCPPISIRKQGKHG